MGANVKQVWDWLGEVTDPEIPVISVVDLGIVRDVSFADEDNCVVTITPTYSGCPAMLVIAQSIEEALKSHGVARVSLKTQLSPAWSTDWMSESGKEKLKAYGIAPPAEQAQELAVIDISQLSRRRSAGVTVQCPHCGSKNTRLSSEFGSTSCKSLYVCNSCKEPFDYFKSH